MGKSLRPNAPNGPRRARPQNNNNDYEHYDPSHTPMVLRRQNLRRLGVSIFWRRNIARILNAGVNDPVPASSPPQPPLPDDDDEYILLTEILENIARRHFIEMSRRRGA